MNYLMMNGCILNGDSGKVANSLQQALIRPAEGGIIITVDGCQHAQLLRAYDQRHIQHCFYQIAGLYFDLRPWNCCLIKHSI